MAIALAIRDVWIIIVGTVLKGENISWDVYLLLCSLKTNVRFFYTLTSFKLLNYRSLLIQMTYNSVTKFKSLYFFLNDPQALCDH